MWAGLMVIIYTPGHNLIADSLILHGIVRLYGNSVRNVERIGERYKVELIEEPENKEILDILAEEAKIYKEYSLDKEPSTISLDSSIILGKIYVSNINPEFSHWVESLENNAKKFKHVTDFYAFDHKNIFREGRRRSRSQNLYTFYLPLSLIYGKYGQSDYRVDESGYYICGNCLLLSSLGIIYGASVVRTDKRTSEGEKSIVTILTLVPIERVRGVDVLLLQRFVEGKGIRLSVELTILASLLYVLSIGETIYYTNFDVECLAWQLRKSGRFQRGLEAISIKINDLLEIIAEIKYRFDDFPKLIRLLTRDEDGAYLLHQLAEALIFRQDVYPVIRDISTYLLDRYSKEEKITCDNSQYCRYAKRIYILADILSKHKLPLSSIKESKEFQKITT